MVHVVGFTIGIIYSAKPNTLIHSWQHTSFLVNHLQTGTQYTDMVHLVTTHIMGYHAPCPYIEYWPEDGSLEPKHVASYVLMTVYVLCLNTLIYHIV